MLELEGISHSFKYVEVLRDVNLVVEKGRRVGLFGASGSGKSTLLYISSFMLKPDFGKVIIDGIQAKKEEDIRNIRRKYFGFIFQFHNLIPEFTGFENVKISCEICGKSEIEYINFILNELGIYEKRNERPATLSGGEAQRFGVARAFAPKPEIVFADEPTGNLDPETAEKTMNLITDLSVKHKTSLLMVTHNYKFKNRFDESFEIKNKTLEKFL